MQHDHSLVPELSHAPLVCGRDRDMPTAPVC
jgi:hypothetical protein